jgi:hypothetical protein
MSAYLRASSDKCRKEIKSVACYYKTLNQLDPTRLYTQIQSKCPAVIEKKGRLVDCIDTEEVLEVSKHYRHVSYIDNHAIHDKSICIDMCLTIHGHSYAAYNQMLKDNDETIINNCVCFEKFPGELSETEFNIEMCKNYNDENMIFYIYTTGHMSMKSIQV